jgi:hypothetical protein
MIDRPDEKTPDDAYNIPMPAENTDTTGEEDTIDPAVLKEIERLSLGRKRCS